MEQLVYLDLFSGIAGFSLGIERVFPRAKCFAFSEIDKSALFEYNKHFPGRKNLGDIAKLVWKHDKNGVMLEDKKGKPIINKKELRKIKGKFNFVCAGTPCQGLSRANITREGLEDKRSMLFYAFQIIVKFCKPKYGFLLENVASMSKETRKIMDKKLRVKSVEVNSGSLSAQNRKRYYWCTWKFKLPKDKGIRFEDIVEKNADPIFDLTKKQLVNIKEIIKSRETHWNVEHERFNAYQFPNTLLAYSRSIRDVFKKDKKGNYVKKKGKKIKIGTYDERRFRVDGKCNTLVTGNGCGGSHSKNFIVMNKKRIRNLTRIECARNQTFPDYWCKDLSKAQAYKCFGNAVTILVIEHIMKKHPLAKKKLKLVKR